MVYRVVLEKGEDSGYIAHCPAIPGCHSQGNNLEEALDNIRDAIIGCLSALDKDLLPLPSKDVTYVEVVV
jgi:predicted RNase H-like HicB family nuclease